MKKIEMKKAAQVYGTVIAMFAIILIFGILRPAAFLTIKNFINISRQMAALTVVSIGATMVMVVNEFDLSVGSMASLGGATVFENIPKSFTWLGTAKIAGIPFLSIIMVVFVAVFGFFMTQTPAGRKMYAIGGGEEAAKIAGISVGKYKILAFVLCAALASGTGIAVASRVGSANTTAGAGYFLQSYAAAYIGCTVSRQGIPNVAGTFVGAAILSILANGLTILQMPSYMQDIITGIIIVVAVIAQKLGRGDAK